MKRALKIMGVINVSPESFYKGSVPRNARELARRARKLTQEGADIIDVGAMSTAPYLKTKISEIEEAKRLSWAVKIIRKNSRLPVSVDTSRYIPAAAGFIMGATHLNDITGLNGDPRLAALAPKFKGLFLMAHPSVLKKNFARPIDKIKAILEKSIREAVKSGAPRSKLIVDPGIGFFRDEKMTWWQWDLSLIQDLKELAVLKCPVLVGISRKSFIGHLMGGAPPEKRLAGSLAVTNLAVQNGATWIRTHDVQETKRFLL